MAVAEIGPLTRSTPRYVAFLRAVNVGGHTVRMEELRSLFTSLGFSGAETFIASGNVVFHAGGKTAASLEKAIEACLRNALGYEVSTFLRTEAELASIAGLRPFSDSKLKAASALNIGFLKAPLTPAAVKTLMTFRTDIDDFQVEGRELFWLCAKKQSESAFSNAAFEKALGVRATFRGINTIVRLAAKYSLAQAPAKSGKRRAG